MSFRTDYCGELGAGDLGRQVSVCGWVASRREHSEHLAFVDLRDHTGVVQCVVDHAHDLRSENVLRITGTVRARGGPRGHVFPCPSALGQQRGRCDLLGDSQQSRRWACQPGSRVAAHSGSVSQSSRTSMDDGVRWKT